MWGFKPPPPLSAPIVPNAPSKVWCHATKEENLGIGGWHPLIFMFLSLIHVLWTSCKVQHSSSYASNVWGKTSIWWDFMPLWRSKWLSPFTKINKKKEFCRRNNLWPLAFYEQFSTVNQMSWKICKKKWKEEIL
jgi:hypothetical protein